MIMHNPTRTTNRLHFEYLETHRFEDLAYELLYRKEVWKRIDNFGRSGSDDGIDIFSDCRHEKPGGQNQPHRLSPLWPDLR